MEVILDSLAERPGALDFYLGHEIGHIKCGHVGRSAFLMPARMLPLIGAADSRAREYTCDLHGLACCDDPKDADFAGGAEVTLAPFLENDALTWECSGNLNPVFLEQACGTQIGERFLSEYTHRPGDRAR